MAQATNDQVIQAWAAGQEARGGNLTSTGSKLFSYALQIGGTYIKWNTIVPGTTWRQVDVKVVGDFTRKGGAFYSVTTSRHVSKAKAVLADVEQAEIFPGLNLVW